MNKNNYEDDCIADYNEDVMEEEPAHHYHVDSVYNSILRINQTKEYREVDNAKKQHEQEQIKIGKKIKEEDKKILKNSVYDTSCCSKCSSFCNIF